jgi:tRNA threonylcarbamoyl adenosine modification protein YjeE
VTVPVTSPTYTVGNRYDGVAHLDLYRLDRVASSDWAALEPYFDDRSIVFVEWPEGAGDRLPPPRLTVRLDHVTPERRLVVLSSDEPDLLAGLI